MSGARQRWLVRLYPAAWRERYGDELAELLEHEAGARVVLDVVRSAAVEWALEMAGLGVRTMETYRSSVIAMARRPSGYAPLILSGCALLMLAGALAYNLLTGVAVKEDHDEGVLAHLYQIMIGAQILIIPWFALRWGRRDWRAGLTLLAAQVLAIACSMVPLWLIEHSGLAS